MGLVIMPGGPRDLGEVPYSGVSARPIKITIVAFQCTFRGFAQ